MRTVMRSAVAHDAGTGQLEVTLSVTGGSLRADAADALGSLDAALRPRGRERGA
jgi:hypothetical protein